MSILSPRIALLYNTKLSRWHPIVFREAPFPGPPKPGKVIRHRSQGHHTDGFESRDDAVKCMTEELVHHLRGIAIGQVAIDTDSAIEWDGEEIPAMTGFFSEPQDGKCTLLLL